MRQILTSNTLLLVGLLFTGCASLPENYPRTTSTAFPNYLSTNLGQTFERVAVQHPGESGFVIIPDGRSAFTARIALTELAQRSIDVQYYIWEPDITGRIFAELLIEAADRGVRVRVLVDDISLKGRDAAVAAMDAHPNIEIRIFNPFARRSARLFDFLLDYDRVNHRMHNKTMIVDNAVAIVGGRNVGNIYFQVATDANYRDLDIAAAGPVVRDISDVFDHFWNGEWAVPIGALVDRPYTEEDLHSLVDNVRERIAEEPFPYPLDQDVDTLKAELVEIRDQFIWAPGQIVWNDPTRMREGDERGAMARAFFNKIATLKKEILIESPYFVVQEKNLPTVRDLKERGVHVRILTNSLASNDVIAAHAGHAKYRKQLVENGVELYEMRADAGTIRRLVVSSKSKAALHAKTVVFDREAVFVGSFNLDPRSATINTEAGLYVESPELAQKVIAFMDEGVLPDNSYRVMLNEDGDLYWLTKVDGEVVRYDEEPGATFSNQLMTTLINILPVESQL